MGAMLADQILYDEDIILNKNNLIGFNPNNDWVLPNPPPRYTLDQKKENDFFLIRRELSFALGFSATTSKYSILFILNSAYENNLQLFQSLMEVIQSVGYSLKSESPIKEGLRFTDFYPFNESFEP
ncbi:MAG: hypothetical protein ACMG57_03390 [Candidatus Dojkabacteria bacterium]